VQLQDSVQKELRKVPIATLLTLPTHPICVVYPVLDVFHLTCHNCIHCPRINIPVTNIPAYIFYWSLTKNSLPSSDAKLSSSSSMAKLQSSCSQSDSSDSSNPFQHHIHSDNESIWGRDSSSRSNSSAGCWQSKSSESSNPHSPHIYLEEGSVWENKSSKSCDPSSSSLVHYKDTEDGETKRSQSSGSIDKSH
jgi:hypothetical protein